MIVKRINCRITKITSNFRLNNQTFIYEKNTLSFGIHAFDCLWTVFKRNKINRWFDSLQCQQVGGNQPPTTYFSIDSQLGFFLNESFAIGPVLGAYSNSLAKLNPVTNLYEKRKYNGFSGGVFARKFFKLSETFLFSLEGKAMAGNVNRPALQYQDDPRDMRFLFAFRPIFSFVPNNRWFFDASIGDLSYGVNWYSFAIDTDQFAASLGQVRIGVNYLFNKND